MKNKKSLGLVFDEQEFHVMEVKGNSTSCKPGLLQTFSLRQNTVLHHLEGLSGFFSSAHKCRAVGVLGHHYYQLFHLARPPSHTYDLKEWAVNQVNERLVFPVGEVVLELFESALPSFIFLLVLHKPNVGSLVAQVRESPCSIGKIIPSELALSHALGYAYPSLNKLGFIYIEGNSLKILLLLNGALVYAGVVFNYIDNETLNDPFSKNTILINIEGIIAILVEQKVVVSSDEISFFYANDVENKIDLSSLHDSYACFKVVNKDDFL